jgi:hypothetical protein
MKNFVLAFVIFALAVAFAGTVPSSHSYTITISQATTVNGTQLTPGEYRLNVAPDKVTLVKGKLNVEVPAKVEASEKKFDETVIRYVGEKLSEIGVGGTKTRIKVTL